MFGTSANIDYQPKISGKVGIFVNITDMVEKILFVMNSFSCGCGTVKQFVSAFHRLVTGKYITW